MINQGGFMNFINCSNTVQAIILKDFISYTKACSDTHYTIEDALQFLKEDLITTYDNEGRID
jgi:hypothetical protein